jgi:hypothetical protein
MEVPMHFRRLAVSTLVAALVTVPSLALAQTSQTIDWASVLTAQSDPRIQVSSCSGGALCLALTSMPLPNSGTAALDRVSYGDIVGDGSTEAVVPIDSGGSIGEIGSLLYMLDDSSNPQLVLADGPGGNVFIDPQVGELVSIGFDPSCSSMRCPAGLIRTGYTLVDGALQQQDSCEFLPSTADQAHPQGSCTPAADAATPGTTVRSPTAAPAGPDLSALKRFPGPVLRLPLDQSPYAKWTFLGARMGAPTAYEESVGEQFQGIGANRISIDGALGPLDATSDPRVAGNCPASKAYCYSPPAAQSSGAEIFNGLKARGNDAFVFHGTFPSQIWIVRWFDKSANSNYALSFTGHDVLSALHLPTTFNQSNLPAATNLASLTDTLVAGSGT